ncbi:hypothetical protein LGH82_22870 [Mesorhizobium sp. PAMC28654]|uniref:hypothetical protein n=1 Tax=Mesorhizobium sp. PAMC28654 TaxID=2880934 RepID=UPI001D0B917F|nr:hypothetical protein [Mesorhizobium sp. PAMC28654]UDL87984.1 hypothetical protein LGH82_22870 [Mesorhizobium sp. PAMC28654]
MRAVDGDYAPLDDERLFAEFPTDDEFRASFTQGEELVLHYARGLKICSLQHACAAEIARIEQPVKVAVATLEQNLIIPAHILLRRSSWRTRLV